MIYEKPAQHSSSGEFYNGNSAIPLEVEVSAHADGLYLSYPSLSQEDPDSPGHFPYSKVKSIHLVGDKLRLELLNDLHPKARFLLTLDNTDIKPVLEKLWSQEKKSFFFKLTLKLRNYSLPKKILIALILVPAFTTLFISISYQAYRLIPMSWEIELGEMVTRQMLKDTTTCDSKELNNLLHKTADSLKDPDSPYSYEITVVNDGRVNAYA
ncbi:MAG: hypothetical protein OEZ36_10645, partial [Spirochaetota bacterium]|nr:hypothetical protein [Spirochaetota bacterium]